MNAKVSAIVTRPCYCSTECYINQTKKIDGTRPYQNPIIPAIISGEFFIRGLALSEAENINRFHVEGFDEPELPPSMVAFAATGVHFIYNCSVLTADSFYKVFASLNEWRTGKYLRAEFSANAFSDVYRTHTQFLSSIRTGNPRGYHHMMARLFRESSCVIISKPFVI